MLRSLIAEFREFPATMALCSLWVIVFVLMVLDQVAKGNIPTLGILALGIRGGHPFGELTIDALFQGEIWRPLTATFVHYGLIHLGMNLFMMYQLGALVESWYGPWQFLAVYVAIGAGGNLVSAVARHALWSVDSLQRLAAGGGLVSALARNALGSDPTAASGGGSTVILGLVALCAVVGWRTRTRIGASLSSQMIWLLIATALLGQIAPIIDNWGHAGGALIGTAIGFTHRILIRTAERPVAKWAGILGLVLLIASGAAQIRDDRDEAQATTAALGHLTAAEGRARTLVEIVGFYRLAANRSRFEHAILVSDDIRRAPAEAAPGSVADGTAPLSLWDSPDGAFRDELKRQLARLDALRDELGTGSTGDDFRQFRTILARVFHRSPTDRTLREFDGHRTALLRRAWQDQQAARVRYETLRRQAHL